MTITNRKLAKIMTLPINALFVHLQKRNRVSVSLFENTSFRLEGIVAGFDEFMNIVLTDAEEVYEKRGGKADKSAGESKVIRRPIGKILLKGDNICMISNTGQN